MQLPIHAQNRTVVHIIAVINTLRPIQNGRHFADDIFKCIFLNENAWISLKISLKFVPKGPINNNPALVQIMAWRRSGDKPLSEPMMVSLLTHICVTRPQWVLKEIPGGQLRNRRWSSLSIEFFKKYFTGVILIVGLLFKIVPQSYLRRQHFLLVSAVWFRNVKWGHYIAQRWDGTIPACSTLAGWGGLLGW